MSKKKVTANGAAVKTKVKRRKAAPKSKRGRGLKLYTTRLDGGDFEKFKKVCKRNYIPQAEMFRRYVAAIAKAGPKTRTVSIYVSGYSPT